MTSKLGTAAAQSYLTKQAFLGMAMAGARALGGRALGSLGIGAGKGVISNTAGVANVAGTATEAKSLWNEARTNL